MDDGSVRGALLRALRGEAAELSPEVIALAEAAGVVHLLAEACRSAPERRSAGQTAELCARLGAAAQKYLASAVMGSVRLEDFREIAEALGAAGIPVAPIKGMAYGLMFERGGPMRDMADIDLLVPEDPFEQAVQTLVELGYEEFYPKAVAHSPAYHERALVREGRMVEIHRAFLPEGRLQIDYQGLWARTLPLEAEGIVCRRLSPDDTLLYHCLHFGLHEFSAGGLRAICELQTLVREDRPDLAAVARRAHQWGAARILWCAFRLREHCFPGSFPEPGLPRLQLSLATRVALEQLVVQPSYELLFAPGPLPRSTQLLRKALLIDRPVRSVAYLAWYLRALTER